MPKLLKSIFFISFLLFFCLTFVLAEEITISTYYPSPYGEYNQLDVHRSVTFHPQANLVAIQSLPNPKVGELVYSQGENQFYYNQTGLSTGWVAQSGGGGGDNYTVFGITTCGNSNYTAAYTGYATTPVSWGQAGNTGTGAGGVICVAAMPGFNVHGSSGWFYWVQNEVVFPSTGVLVSSPCAVCVKH